MSNIMNGLLWHRDGTISVEKSEVPVITNETDAVIKVKMSSICTSDLHIIHGFVPKALPDTILGHEFVGEVVSVGSSVKGIKAGDRVAVNVETFCGECFFCKRGFINNCETGGWKLGCTINGCQAEYVRVPFANTGLTKLPDNVSYEDALFVGDILSSGYWAAEICEIEKDSTVAVIGSGPVGMCAMMSAKILGAGKVIAIDTDDSRLEIAEKQKIADIFLNSNKVNIEQEVKKYTSNRGADSVIEAAGGKDTFEMAWKIARPHAIVAVAAMYEEFQCLPLPDMYGKNLIFKTGGVDAINCKKLVELISQGKISTNFLITHKYKFEEIINAYDIFENKKDNCLKVAITY